MIRRSQSIKIQWNLWNVSFCLLFMLLKELFVCTQSIKFNGMCGMYQAFCLLSMLLKELFVFTQSIKCIGMFGFYHAYCLFFMLLKELFVVIS